MKRNFALIVRKLHENFLTNTVGETIKSVSFEKIFREIDLKKGYLVKTSISQIFCSRQ